MPKRDLLAILARMTELFTAGDPQWWDNLKQQSRYAASLHKDLATQHQKLEQSPLAADSAKQTLFKARKEAHAISTIAAAYCKAGAYSRTVVTAINEAAHYLRLEPSVTLVFLSSFAGNSNTSSQSSCRL